MTKFQKRALRFDKAVRRYFACRKLARLVEANKITDDEEADIRAKVIKLRRRSA